MTESLNVIIGAGFSFYAGLPLGKDVNAMFDQPFRGRLLKWSSSEWMWAEFQDENARHNGTLNSDHLEYSFIMDEVVAVYKLQNGNSFTDYEDFFQYVLDNAYEGDWYDKIIDSAKKKFYSETEAEEDSEYSGFAFRGSLQRGKPIEIINHLISDMLRMKITETELKIIYKPFIDYIQKYSEINIFTLNHDTILERLFKLFELNYCDGFSTTDSNLVYSESGVPIYQGEFESAKIRLFKLHGSTDMNLYEHLEQKGGLHYRTGDFTYFKPRSYHEKHSVSRINPINQQVLQSHCFDIVPKFITGKKKLDLINSDYMYSELHKKYQESISKKQDVLIIGYSFRDTHINGELEKFDLTNPSVVNLNYGDKFPYQAKSILEITQFSELN